MSNVGHVLEAVATPPAWINEAACASSGLDPDLWFTETGGNYSKQAKRVCATCSVRLSCLEWALTLDDPMRPNGLWGGCTPSQRSRLAARRQRAGGCK